MILDCHCHIIPAGMLTGAVPADWRPALTEDAGRRVVTFQGRRLTSITGEFCDVDIMLAQAAAVDVTHLLLSPWILLIPTTAEPALAARVCRVQNESLAEAASHADGRAFGLGAVPLQDPAHAVAELEYLMGLPGMRGVEVPASVAGSYLGESRFAPFWAAAADCGAVVFVHPTTTGLSLSGLEAHYLWNSVGNPIETTIAAAQLVTSGVLSRHPDLKVLLAHGGGGLVALRGRLGRAYDVRPEARADGAAAPADGLRRLYYDSLTHDRDVLADVIGFAGAEHVLLGSDRPFDMGADRPADDIAALGLSPADEELLLSGSARRLLGLQETSEVDCR
ncbi:MAG TPA: amidohydrolase family protein [Streptosporangiaceae bacterium]|nr:amidohydrolase family protein [Streptosporangiaceae bacterium]